MQFAAVYLPNRVRAFTMKGLLVGQDLGRRFAAGDPVVDFGELLEVRTTRSRTPSSPHFGSMARGRAPRRTLPARIAEIVGVRARTGDREIGRTSVAALRWSLGSSPDWQLALVRVGAEPPQGVTFRQPLPPEARLSDLE